MARVVDAAGAAELRKELVQVLGVQGGGERWLDGPAPLPASDLRALMNRMHLRSEHVKDRVRRCVISQRDEFARAFSSASASLNHFSEVSQELEPLVSPDNSSCDPSSLCAELSALVEQTHRARREVGEKKEAILVVERIAHLHETLKRTSLQLADDKLVEAAQCMLDAKHELGLYTNVLEDVEVAVEGEDIRPYALLKQIWSNTFSKMSAHLEEHFDKLVSLDAKKSKLHIQNGTQLERLLTAMDRIGLLETAFARFADGLMKTVISFILQDPSRVDLSEELAATEATLSWGVVPKLEGDLVILELLYSKLLLVVKFLRLYVSCGHDPWMKDLGRFIWPRMADAIISGYLSKAVPNEVSEVARFQESANLTFQFEKSLSEISLIRELSSPGDKLGKFAADVELHFVAKKKARIMARVRRLLVRSEFSSFSRKGSKRVSGSTHENSEQNRTELFFQPESCVISHAAKQLMDIVHDVLADACVVASKMSLELYHAGRDAFLLYAAIVPVKLGKELKELSLEAIIHHNDCLYLAHESLALAYQYREGFPLELKEKCMFADLFPFFQEMADQVLKQQLKLRETKLNEALDEGNGFRCTHEIHSYELASLAIDQVVLNLENARMLWKPVMVHTVYASSMGFLMTSAFGRMVSEILDISDMDVREVEQLHQLILALDDRLLPLMQSLVDEGKQDTTDPGYSSSLNEVGRLVPTWCKLLRLAELLNMPSSAIAKAWESGNLALCGFSSSEVQNLIKAMFQDSEKRKETLKRIANKTFQEHG